MSTFEYGGNVYPKCEWGWRGITDVDGTNNPPPDNCPGSEVSYGPDIWDDVGVYLGGNETSSFTKVSNNAFNVDVSVSNAISIDRPLVNGETTGKTVGKTYELSFYADVLSGTPVIYKFYDGQNVIVNYPIVQGENKLPGVATNTSTALSWYFDGTQVFDIEISNIQVREVL